MADEIRLLSIELENFRQYYSGNNKTQKINFSSREEGFTVIAGKNGEGKSNLLNAISWCFYHEESHGMGNKFKPAMHDNKELSIINNRYITEKKEGTRATTSVKVDIQKGDTVYSISRVLAVLKHKLEYKKLSDGTLSLLVTSFATDKVPKGCEILDEAQSFVVMKKGPNDADFHNTINEGDPNTIVRGDILPQGLSKYFLLDGEFLEGFWKDPDIIRTGIENISDLHLLSSLKEHVEKMRIPPKGIGKDTDALTAKIQMLAWDEQSLDEDGNENFSQEVRWKADPNEEDTYYHATGTPRIRDLKNDIKRMESRSSDILVEVSSIGVPNIKLLKKTYDDKLGQFEEEKTKCDSIGKKYRYNLVTKSPYLFLKKGIEDSVEIIQNAVELGHLPVRHRKQFADELLQRGDCICGEHLESKLVDDKETNEKRVNIEKYRDQLTGKENLDAGVDMKYDFTHDFIDNYDTFLKTNFGDLRTTFSDSETKCNDLNNELKGISAQLGSAGDDATTKLIDENDYLRDQVKNLNEKITGLTLTVNMNAKTRGDTKRVLDTALKKNAAAEKIVHDGKIWDKIAGHLHQVYEETKEGIRKDVQANTWKNWKELITYTEDFKSFLIEPDYSVYMIDNFDVNKIDRLSTGQSLILTLAFVAVLRKSTGYRFPLVLDSPLSTIDGHNRYNIATCLPGYLPDDQLTLLATDTQYTANIPADPEYPKLPTTPFAKLLEEKVKLKHWKIKKEKKGDNAGNSTINLAHLEFNEDKQSWMVVEDG